MSYFRGSPYNAAWGIRQDAALPQIYGQGGMIDQRHLSAVGDRYPTYAAEQWARGGGWANPGLAQGAYGGFQGQYMAMQSPWGATRRGGGPFGFGYGGGFPSYGGYYY